MKAKYFRIENFLSPAQRDRIFDFAVTWQHSFIKSGLTPYNDKGRSSRVMYQFPLADIVTNRIKPMLAVVQDALGVESIAVGYIDCQLTASNDGDFLMMHPDKTPSIPQRYLSFIYYLHKEPKPFNGGELRLYDHREDWERLETFQTIEPKNNSLLLFDSRVWHEVLPVKCQAKVFENSRFTVNGWFNHHDETNYQSALTIP